MEIFDIINAINAVNKDKIDGHYILHKSMELTSIKVYKKFIYVLYFVNKGNQEVVFTYQNVIKIPSTNIEEAWSLEDKNFLKQLLTWFKYGKLNNEQILDTNN